MNKSLALLRALSEIFRQPVSEESAAAYCRALAGYADAAVAGVLMHALREGDRIPTPREVRQILPSPETPQPTAEA